MLDITTVFFALNRALGYSLDSYIPWLLLAYLAGGIALRVDSRIAIGIALLLLAYTPFILIQGNEAYANQIATCGEFCDYAFQKKERMTETI